MRKPQAPLWFEEMCPSLRGALAQDVPPGTGCPCSPPAVVALDQDDELPLQIIAPTAPSPRVKSHVTASQVTVTCERGCF